MRSLARGAAVLFVFGLSIAAGQAQSSSQMTGHVIVPPGDMKWGPAPPGLPPGAQAVVLSGDPSKPEPFTLTVKFPDGYTVPAHWHSMTENVVIVSGNMMLGMGEKVDASAMKTVGPGGYVMLPKEMRHYVKAKGAATIVIYGTGPFDITYVDPKDDPRLKK